MYLLKSQNNDQLMTKQMISQIFSPFFFFFSDEFPEIFVPVFTTNYYI